MTRLARYASALLLASRAAAAGVEHVEMVRGLHAEVVGRERQALERGLHVVTANKAVIAARGR